MTITKPIFKMLPGGATGHQPTPVNTRRLTDIVRSVRYMTVRSRGLSRSVLMYDLCLHEGGSRHMSPLHGTDSYLR